MNAPLMLPLPAGNHTSLNSSALSTWYEAGKSDFEVLSILRSIPGSDGYDFSDVMRRARRKVFGGHYDDHEAMLRLGIELPRMPGKIEIDREEAEYEERLARAATESEFELELMGLHESKSTAKVKTKVAAESFSENVETVTADKVKSKRINFLWGRRIPLGKLSVFCGNPDKGKSLVSTYVVSRVTRGLPLYGDSAAQIGASDVLIMAAEDDVADTIRPRLEAADADLSRVHILTSIVATAGSLIARREAQLDTDVKIIRKKLLENPEIRLVVVDPISSYLGNANMNREQEVRRVLTPLKELAAECGVTILMIMHLNKSADQEAIHRIGGAVAFTGVSRAVWLFTNATDEEGEEDPEKFLMLRVKNNLARPTGGLTYHIPVKFLNIEGYSTATPYADFTGETDQKATTLLPGGKLPNGRPPEKKQDARAWLLEFLGKNGMETTSDIKSFGRRKGYSLRTLETLKAELNIESRKIDNRWCWLAPDFEPLPAKVATFDK
jgi:archaellum biogenesis ATPase FlaH